MQLDLLGASGPRSSGWVPSDQNLVFVSLPGDDLRQEVQDRGEGLRASLALGALRPTRVQHVTICHFGHYGHIPDAVAAAREIGQAMIVPRSEIVLDRYGNFRGREDENPFVFSASRTPDALRLLNGDLAKRVRRLGLECKVGITAHATLRYGAEQVPFAELAPPIVWPFDELVLIMSRRGATEHVVLDRWPVV